MALKVRLILGKTLRLVFVRLCCQKCCVGACMSSTLPFSKTTEAPSFSNLCLKVENCDVNPINCCSTHPHNIFMQFLSELGLIGVMFLIFFYFYLICQIVKIFFKKKYLLYDNAKIILLIGMFINFFPLITSGNFFNNRFSFIYYLFFALYIHIDHISNQNVKNRDN